MCVCVCVCVCVLDDFPNDFPWGGGGVLTTANTIKLLPAYIIDKLSPHSETLSIQIGSNFVSRSQLMNMDAYTVHQQLLWHNGDPQEELYAEINFYVRAAKWKRKKLTSRAGCLVNI